MAENGSVVVAIKDEQQQQQQAPVSPAATVITHHHHDSTIATPITSSGVISATASASSTPTPSIQGGGDGQAGSEVHEDDGGFGGWYAFENGNKNADQIQLETPAVEEKSSGGGGLNVAAKPKRLSDEFYSADDDYEDEEDEDDEMMGGGVGASVSGDCGGSASGSSSAEGGLEKTAADCEAHADLNEIKNLSITNGSGGGGGGVEMRDQEDRFAERNDNSIPDPIYIGEETSSCSRGEGSSGVSGVAASAAEAHMEHDQAEEDDDDDEDELQDVQSRDAIERRDFEQEQKLTGGIIIKNSAFIPTTDRLNLDLLSRIKRMRNDVLAAKKPAKSQPLASTPTSSRHPYKSGNPTNSSSTTSSREQQQNSNSSTTTTTTTTKSAVKVNLSASLEDATVAAVDGPSCSSSSSSSSASGSGKSARRQQQIEAFLNGNSNDSLSSDRSIFIPNLQALKASVKDVATAPNSSSSTTAVNEPSSSSSSPSPSSSASSAGPSSTAGGTATKPPSDCSLSSCATSVIKQTGECSKNINHHAIPSTSTSNSSLFSFSCPFGSADRETGEGCSSSNLGRFPSSSSNFTDTIADEVVEPANSTHRNNTSSNANPEHVEDPLLEPSQLSMPPELVAASVDHECDEDNWADCEEGSDEEVCTCRDYTDDEGDDLRGDHPSSEDELPSRDVDLSSYTHMDAAEDILAHDPSGSTTGNATANAKHQDAQTPRLHRKRKLTENRINLFGSGGGGAGSSSRCSTGSMADGGGVCGGATGGGSSLGTLSDSPSTESLNFSSRKRLALDSTSSPRASLLSPSNVSLTLEKRKTLSSILRCLIFAAYVNANILIAGRAENSQKHNPNQR